MKFAKIFFPLIVFLSFMLLPALHAADSSVDGQKQAAALKAEGDRWVTRDNYESAAKAYERALLADRKSFSLADRTQMAVHMSWGNRLDAAVRELRAVIDEEPKSIGARVHLARVLTWRGELAEGIEQSDMILKELPDLDDALMVKADALQWQGRYSEAIPLYQKLVAKDGSFDARAGLTRSMLAVKNRTAALAGMSALKPANARQQRETEKLAAAVNQETRPLLDGRYNYYEDSDHNRLNRYALAGSFWGGNQKYTLNYRHTDADDRSRSNHAEELLFSVYSRITDRLAGGAAIGFTQLRDRQTSNFPSGHLKLDAKLFSSSAGASMSREVLTDTAELIQNRIRMTNVGIYLNQPLTERLSVNASYHYKSFSDGNHANDLQLTSQYAIILAPRVMIGHRFRLLDFHKQSGSGFFDPNNYIANRAFASTYYENRYFYTYLEGFVGYETFRRNGFASDNFIHGGAGSLGVKPRTNFAIEVNVEGGNFAAGSASGFNYFNIGPRITYRF